MTRRIAGLSLLGAATTSLAAAEPSALQQPVFVQLIAKVDDYFEIKVTEDRIQRAIRMAEKLREKHPGLNATVTLYLNGAISEALFQRKTETLDRIQKAVQAGIAEIGYDGVDEPTHLSRPHPNFRKAKDAEGRWLARTEAFDWFLNEWKDPVNGDPVPEKAGGLKRTIEVFGKVSAIQGVTLELGGDPELVHLLGKFGQNYAGFGFPEGNTFPARNLHGFGGSVGGVAKLMSPAPNTSPEVFWLDGVLRLSDNNGSTVHRTPLSNRPALEKMTGAIDRSRPHLLRIDVANYLHYYKAQTPPAILANPLRYGYDNPKVPNLGMQALNSAPDLEAAYQKDEETLDWLAQFLAGTGGRFVAPSQVLKMALPANGAAVSRASLLTAVQGMLKKWAEYNNYVPEHATADGQFFSPADMFYLLSRSLATLHQTGALPESVTLKHVYGPLPAPPLQGPSQGTASAKAITLAAAGIAPALASTEWTPVPADHIPGWVDVGGLRVNAAQFLRLMAQRFEKAASGAAETSFEIKTCEMPTPLGLVFPTTRPGEDMGQTWTAKPAVLKLQ